MTNPCLRRRHWLWTWATEPAWSPAIRRRAPRRPTLVVAARPRACGRPATLYDPIGAAPFGRRSDTSENALSRTCAPSRTDVGSRSSPLAAADSPDVFCAVSQNDAGRGQAETMLAFVKKRARALGCRHARLGRAAGAQAESAAPRPKQRSPATGSSSCPLPPWTRRDSPWHASGTRAPALHAAMPHLGCDEASASPGRASSRGR